MSEIKSTAHDYAQRGLDAGKDYAAQGIDLTKDLSNRSKEDASRGLDTGKGLFNYVYQQGAEVCLQVGDMTKHYWSQSPPLRWATYVLTAFNAIPIAILIFWALVALGFVSLPVVGFLIFVAFILAGFALFAWGGVNVVMIISTKLGLM
ncbi:hypothetical protein C1645_746650, partial [Glomus cerebriforme]